jgi:hypothetical protein
LTGDKEGEYPLATLTPSSYVAYYDKIDVDALSKSGTGYKQWSVATGDDLQMRIFADAVRSRDRNNNGEPDPQTYSFGVFNCGSWCQYILARHGVEFPDKTINHGNGLTTKGVVSNAGYWSHAAARVARGFREAVIDFGALIITTPFP